MKRHLWLGSLLILLDQLTKWLATDVNFNITGFIRLSYVTNTGAAFGMFKGFGLALTLVSIVAIILLVYSYKAEASRLTKTSLIIILAGCFGNLIDRLVFGHVRDFISVGNFPTFNMADSMITAGVIMILVEMAYNYVKKKR